MDKTKKISEEEIVTLIDQFMARGGGHMNIDIHPNNSDLPPSIQEMKSSECSSKSMSCQVPTLHQGLDGQE